MNAKKRKIEEQENEKTFRLIVDLNTLIWQLKDGCSKCNENSLLLTNVYFNEKCSSNRLDIVCGRCHKKILITSEEVEKRWFWVRCRQGKALVTWTPS